MPVMRVMRVRADHGLGGAPRQVLLALIKLYQSLIAPALPPACRYLPSCSQYGYEAIERYGALKGSWLTLKRLARCQPFGGHGYDPVPPDTRYC